MPLELPNLDDRRYADLVAEARRLIPVYDPEWTNHNPSDPGITLVELFAYLTEMLLYRLDRVTADNQRKFLKLLNGPDWTPGADLNADIRAAVLAVRARERAVTVADFERLATDDFNAWLATLQRAEQDGAALDEWWRVTRLDPADVANLPSTAPAVARAVCVASRNLERGSEAARTAYAPAHVSLIVLPRESALSQPPATQKAALWGYLDERRTLTTRHHVVGPYYAPISAEIVIASTSGAVMAAVRDRVLGQLAGFLDRLTGGATQDGWPFGRDVYISELYELIEAVEGVDYITDLMLFSACLPADANCAAATPLWHAEGDQVGMALAPHHLPLARFDTAALVIAPNTIFLSARLTVTLIAASAAEPATLKRLAKAAVRGFFHPLHQGPAPGTPTDTDLMLVDLKTVLEEIAGVTAVAAFELQADAARLLTQGGQVIGLHVAAGELVNLRAQIIAQAT
jgi:hypothetical protein